MTLGDGARYLGLYDVIEPAYSRYQARAWRRAGWPTPAPNAVKWQTLRSVAQDYRLRTLIETGTFKADAVRALRKDFAHIVSVELSPGLHARALRRTRHQANAELVLGDSALVLPTLARGLDRPALFWLDAHYSGIGTALGSTISPIEAELNAILATTIPGHVVVIDDAREFHNSERSGYPTSEVVYSAAENHGYRVSERHDMFHLLPD
ncbi:MAG: class I SAM-dependent methyltransferase [Acidimicrobiales bacterium]